MAYGQSQDHEAPPALEEKDLNWNTHRKIKEAFGFPQDDELFVVWLDWFYQRLNADQRRVLRKIDLTTLNKDEFPRPPII